MCTITNCTFNSNSAEYGGAIYNNNSSPQITNCILYGNDATTSGDEIYNTGSSSPSISYCCIYDCYDASEDWYTTLGTDGGGNTEADPDFYNTADADGTDDDFFTFDDGLRLRFVSPCIDAGDDESDYSNEPLPNGGRVNLGAYGNTSNAAMTWLTSNPWENVNVDYNPYDPDDLLPGTITVDGYQCVVLPLAILSSGYEINYHNVSVTFTGTGTCKISLAHSGLNDPDDAASKSYLHSALTQVDSEELLNVISPYKNEHYSWLFIYTEGTVDILSIEYLYIEGEGTLYGHTAQTYEFTGRDLPYRIMFPHNYDPTKKYPLVLNVHSSGGIGTNNYSNMEMVTLPRHLFTQYLNDVDLECISIVPQSPSHNDSGIPAPYYPTGNEGEPTSMHPDWSEVNGNGWYNQSCLALVNGLITSNIADPDRIYVAGFSLGGKACWEFLRSAPGLFAGALCCGGWPIGWAYSNPVPDLSDELAEEVQIYKDVPVWIFVGENDYMRYGSKAVHDEIILQGGTSTYTEWPGKDHVGSAYPTWSNINHIEWLFGQSQ